MKVFLAIPQEDHVINEYVKKWPKVVVIGESNDITKLGIEKELSVHSDALVISEDICGDANLVLQYIAWWRSTAKDCMIVLLSNDHNNNLVKECREIGVSVIENLPDLSLVNLARTIFIGVNEERMTKQFQHNANKKRNFEDLVRNIDCPIKLYPGVQSRAVREESKKVTPQPLASAIEPIPLEGMFKPVSMTKIDKMYSAGSAMSTVDNDNVIATKYFGLDNDINFLPKPIRDFVTNPNNQDYLQLIYHFKVDRKLSVKNIATLLEHCFAMKRLLED